MSYNTVLLNCGTIGKTDLHSEVGDEVYVTLCDENGHPVEVYGEVIEILEGD